MGVSRVLSIRPENILQFGGLIELQDNNISMYRYMHNTFLCGLLKEDIIYLIFLMPHNSIMFGVDFV